MSYSYNADGIRVSKNVNDVRHEYYLDGSRIIKETWADQTLEFLYDENGSVYCIVYTGGDGAGRYYLLKNLQGDVTRILNNNLETVAQYVYDPWGKLVNILDADGEPNSGISIANINPIRYRGYYFDMETGFYYLNARYYDPALGRFISPDIPASLGADVQNLSQYNLYAYCFNNPINMADYTGNWPSWGQIFTVVAAVAVVAVAVVATVATCGAAAPTIGVAAGGISSVNTAAAIVSGTLIANAVINAVENQTNCPDPHDQSVYVMRDKESNKVQYVGRTNNPQRRQYEHSHDPSKANLQPLEVKYTGLSVQEARIMEQALISAYTLKNLSNARREIAVSKLGSFSGNMSYFVKLPGSYSESELLCYMER